MTGIVGITTYATRARWGNWEQLAALLPETYVGAVQRVGGVPLLLPPSAPDDAPNVLERIDALVIAGGGDVAPARFGAEPEPRTDEPEHERDAWELALTRAALDRGMPLLGTCRGAQVLAVARGGDLVQHLPDVVGHEGHSPAPARYGMQRMKIAPDSRVGTALGDTVEVPCHHHQGFGRLGAGVRTVAWADDGIPEAIELDNHPFVVGAQWHPERSGDDRLFTALLDATST